MTHPTCHPVYKVVLVGCFGVGKTSLFWRLKTGQFMHHETEDSGKCLSDRCTISYIMQSGVVVQVRPACTGWRVARRDIVHVTVLAISWSPPVQLDVWDTVGMERQNRLPHSYYRQAHAVVLVYDTTLFNSLSLLSQWLEDLAMLPADTLCVLIGSKCDLPSDMSQELIDAFVEENQINLHFSVSAKEDRGVHEAFETIACTLYHRDQACPMQCCSLQAELEESRTQTGLAVSACACSPSRRRTCCS